MTNKTIAQFDPAGSISTATMVPISQNGATQRTTIQAIFDLLAASGGILGDGTVLNTNLADMAEGTIKGRHLLAGTGSPEDLTAGQAAAIVQGDGLTVDLAGFRGIPQNSKSADYVCIASDAGKHIYHPASDNNTRTFTLPPNSSIAFPLGTAITFVNESASDLNIASSDTITLSGSTATGPFTLSQNGMATAVKTSGTGWQLIGSGINGGSGSGGSGQSLTSQGYTTLPGGVIINWGQLTVPGELSTGSAVFTFSKPFTTSVFCVLSTPRGTSNGGGQSDFWGVGSPSLTAVTVYNQYDSNLDGYVLAIGY